MLELATNIFNYNNRNISYFVVISFIYFFMWEFVYNKNVSIKMFIYVRKS